MSKSTELRKITELVKEVLTLYPEARNSDDKLYFLVCRTINTEGLNKPFNEVVLNRKAYGYPAPTYVARAGRKARERYPELSGSEEVEEEREINEIIFEEYAKANI